MVTYGYLTGQIEYRTGTQNFNKCFVDKYLKSGVFEVDNFLYTLEQHFTQGLP